MRSMNVVMTRIGIFALRISDLQLAKHG
jgi:hypothetical protein